MTRLLAATLMLVGASAAGFAQEPAPHEHEHQTPPAAIQAQPDMKMCQEMMSRHQQMMSAMRAMDARLLDQVKVMQRAQGEAKIDAIAGIVTALVEQRSQMHERMIGMQMQMMGHAMQHGGQGASSMMQCPMMQEMMKH